MRKTKDKTESNGAEWQAEIPKKAVTKIAFYRLTKQNGSTQATIYNAWHTRENVMSMVNNNIPSNWYTNGNLQETRRVFDSTTNTYNNALVYTAVHGNNYSTTEVESERLSPCIGYWSFDTGSGGSSGGGGGGESGGGGGSGSGSHTNCSTTVVLRVPNDLTDKGWVFNSDLLGFEADSGNSFFFSSNSNGMSQTFTLPVGDKIVRICKKNGSGVTYYPFSGGTSTWTVPDSASWTVTVTMTQSDHWNHN